MGIVAGYQGESKMAPAERQGILSRLPRGGALLEIGTYDGVSAAVMASRRPDATVVSVDAFIGDSGTHIANWYANRRQNQALLACTSDVGMGLLSGARFDVVLVDGDHSEHGCRCDLLAAGARVKPDGWIVAHDYHPAPGNTGLAGVRAAADRLVRNSSWTVVEIIGSAAFMRRACSV